LKEVVRGDAVWQDFAVELKRFISFGDWSGRGTCKQGKDGEKLHDGCLRVVVCVTEAESDAEAIDIALCLVNEKSKESGMSCEYLYTLDSKDLLVFPT
jgi:hypothetical protein